MNRNRAKSNKRPVVVAVGEMLWDLLPSGKELGGAPTNFACQAQALGARAWPVSSVGRDALGQEILERLEALGLRHDLVQVHRNAPTGTVAVKVAPDGQPHFTIQENVAWDAIPANAAMLAVARRADAICFGSLAQRSPPSRRSIRRLVTAAPARALRIFDINLRQRFYSMEVIETSLRLANVVKLNDAELPIVAKMFRISGDVSEQLSSLARRFDLRLAALTRGARGSLLFERGRWSDHPGLRVRVRDSVGAGDAFTAAMALGILAGWALDEVNLRANEVAAFVCSKQGGTPTLPKSLRRAFLE
jgi:fructokinase